MSIFEGGNEVFDLPKPCLFPSIANNIYENSMYRKQGTVYRFAILCSGKCRVGANAPIILTKQP